MLLPSVLNMSAAIEEPVETDGESEGATGTDAIQECLPQEDVLTDLISGLEVRATPKEELVQRTIEVLAAEYKFPLTILGRDLTISIDINGKRARKSCDIVVFSPGAPKTVANAIRLIIVQPPGVKASDSRKGIQLLKDVMSPVDSCEFGMWTNGRDIAYLRKVQRALGEEWQELTDFPGYNESLDDLERPDRRMARVAVTSDLRDTVLRCHDYLYGNQTMSGERSFLEMIKLIFSRSMMSGVCAKVRLTRDNFGLARPSAIVVKAKRPLPSAFTVSLPSYSTMKRCVMCFARARSSNSNLNIWLGSPVKSGVTIFSMPKWT